MFALNNQSAMFIRALKSFAVNVLTSALLRPLLSVTGISIKSVDRFSGTFLSSSASLLNSMMHSTRKGVLGIQMAIIQRLYM